jgi:hypothetical protein
MSPLDPRQILGKILPRIWRGSRGDFLSVKYFTVKKSPPGPRQILGKKSHRLRARFKSENIARVSIMRMSLKNIQNLLGTTRV